METGKLPSGSLASWRLPPQDATPAARSSPTTPIPIRLRAFRGRAVEALSSKGAGNIPRTLPPPIRLRIASSGDFLGWRLWATVAGGDPWRHHITFLCVVRATCGAAPHEGGRLRRRANGQIRSRQGIPPGQVSIRAGRRHDDPDRQDDRLGGPSAVSVRRGVHWPVPFRPPALLVPDDDLDAGLRLRRARPAGRQLPLAVRGPRSPRRLLRARVDPRVRTVRDCCGRRRRGRDGDHGGPRRPEDSRGARRASGARRRSDQESRRSPLPGADADHRPDGHLRADLRHRGRHRRGAALQRAARRLLRHPLQQRLCHGPLGVGPENDLIRGHHRDRLLLQGDDCVRRRRRSGPCRQRGGRDRLHGRVRLQLPLHADAARDAPRAPGDQVNAGWLAVPRGWLNSIGEIFGFSTRVAGLVYTGRVFQFFGEALRQTGILILGSTIVIWGLVFILGLQCGIEGAYFNRSVGSPAYAGVFAAWCDLREVIPYAFGYMLAAKVGTGIVAELGAMRISDEIDALEVMGVPPVTFLAATRLLAAWIAFPFMYLAAVGIGYFASWLAVVEQIGDVSSGGYFLIFWMFQNPPDLLFSLIKGMVMATVIVLVGCYYGYTASGGPVGVGTATAKSMVLNIVLVHIIGMMGTLVFWGANPRAPIGG